MPKTNIEKSLFNMKGNTSKEIRQLIIWAKSEIDEYEEFISMCEKRIKTIRKERTKK